MKIMVCYDGSKSSKKALLLGRFHAKKFGASIEIVTSMLKGTENEQKIMDKFEKEHVYEKKLCEQEGITCNTQLLVRGLHSGEDIVEYAKNNNIDEIIVGIEKRSKVGKLLLGSTAQHVVLCAPCPVVTVKNS